MSGCWAEKAWMRGERSKNAGRDREVRGGVEEEYEAAQRMHFKHNAAFSSQESIHLFN